MFTLFNLLAEDFSKASEKESQGAPLRLALLLKRDFESSFEFYQDLRNRYGIWAIQGRYNTSGNFSCIEVTVVRVKHTVTKIIIQGSIDLETQNQHRRVTARSGERKGVNGLDEKTGRHYGLFFLSE